MLPPVTPHTKQKLIIQDNQFLYPNFWGKKKSIKNVEKMESSIMKGILAMKIGKSRQTFAFVACDTIRNTTSSISR